MGARARCEWDRGRRVDGSAMAVYMGGVAVRRRRSRQAQDAVALLYRGHVDLVVHKEAAHVLAVALDQVDELVDGAVLPEEHLAHAQAHRREVWRCGGVQ
eukprot:1283434-Prymnesium_polylepis.1